MASIDRLRQRDINCFYEPYVYTEPGEPTTTIPDFIRSILILEKYDKTVWYAHAFVSKHAIMEDFIEMTNHDYKWIENNVNDDEWIVIDFWSQIIGVFEPESVQEELERQVFNELVSVPAGRFRGLLPDGGVEYQRQLARFSEITVNRVY